MLYTIRLQRKKVGKIVLYKALKRMMMMKETVYRIRESLLSVKGQGKD